MTQRRLRLRAVPVIAAVGLLVAGVLGTPPGPSSAATGAAPTLAPAAMQAGLDVAFGEPLATGSLTQPVEFTTTFEAATPPERVELLTRVPGSTSDTVRQAAVEQGADGSWTARVVDAGFTPPNTVQDFRFRATTGTDRRSDRPGGSRSPTTGSSGGP